MKIRFYDILKKMKDSAIQLNNHNFHFNKDMFNETKAALSLDYLIEVRRQKIQGLPESYLRS